MFPSTAPLNGPSSSFAIGQDRFALANAIAELYASFALAPSVQDPDAVVVPTPSLGSTLQVALAAGSATVAGVSALLPAMTLTLPSYALTYVDAQPVGRGVPGDFPLDTLLQQTTGTYTGAYSVLPAAAIAASPLNISDGATLVQRYTAAFTNANGGLGPALLDASGNGFVVRAAAGGGGIFSALHGSANGAALAFLTQNSVADGKMHSFELDAAATTTGFALTVLIDGVVAAECTVTSTLDPTSLFPAFVSDGGNVYLQSWGWEHADGTPVVGWSTTSTMLTDPDPGTAGKHIFLIETGAAPLSVLPLYERKTATTQLAATRDALGALQKAYL